jgi:CheY-like chemotaxis protein
MTTCVLIVEDNAANMELMTYLLTAFGYTVIAAGDGEEGIGAAQRELPDLIICDIHLPKMDGYEVARRLKQGPLPALSSIPLVGVTALAMVGDRNKVLASGFDGYISKPIEPETFVQQCEAFLPPALRVPRPVDFARPEGFEKPVEQAGVKETVLLVADDLDTELKQMQSLFKPSGFETKENRHGQDTHC